HWSGITPALNEGMVAVCKNALNQAKQKGLTISADLNYRSSLWQYGKASSEVMPDLLQYCDVLLADIDTAKLYFGISPDMSNPVASTCELLQQRLPRCKYIAMTMRGQSSASSNEYCGYLWTKEGLCQSQSYKIEAIAERIGAGDAFMAGLIYALRNE